MPERGNTQSCPDFIDANTDQTGSSFFRSQRQLPNFDSSAENIDSGMLHLAFQACRFLDFGNNPDARKFLKTIGAAVKEHNCRTDKK